MQINREKSARSFVPMEGPTFSRERLELWHAVGELWRGVGLLRGPAVADLVVHGEGEGGLGAPM